MRYWVLSYDRGKFYLNAFEADDDDKAVEVINDDIQTNYSTDILMNKDEFLELIKVVDEYQAEHFKLANTIKNG